MSASSPVPVPATVPVSAPVPDTAPAAAPVPDAAAPAPVEAALELVAAVVDEAPGRVMTAIYAMQDAEALFRVRLRDMLHIGANELLAVQFIGRLDLQGQDVRPKDVAASLGVTSSAASIIVGHLVELGHVTRHLNPLDGRGQLLHLTPTVRSAVLSAAGAGDLKALQDGFGLSDRESRRIAQLLGTITAGYGNGARPGPAA